MINKPYVQHVCFFAVLGLIKFLYTTTTTTFLLFLRFNRTGYLYRIFITPGPVKKPTCCVHKILILKVMHCFVDKLLIMSVINSNIIKMFTLGRQGENYAGNTTFTGRSYAKRVADYYHRKEGQGRT